MSSRGNYDKPFFVDVGTSVAAIRCASDFEVVWEYDHAYYQHALKLCGRLNAEALLYAGNAARLRNAAAAYLALWDTGKACDLDRLKSVIHEMRAAFMAPARNCDVYKTTAEARLAYHLEGDGLMTMQAFCDWFLSPAPRKSDLERIIRGLGAQEGGHDGNE